MPEPRLPPVVRFADLIAPVTARDFTDQYLEAKPLVLSRREPRYYRSLLSLGDVDSLMHVLKDKPGDVLTLVAPPDSGRKTVRRSLREIRMSEVYGAFGAGDTVCLNGIQGAWPSLVALKQDMNRALGANVFMNLYLTPASSQGFAIHADTHDVFILQIEGAKEWFLYEPGYLLPIEGLHYSEHIRAAGKGRITEENSRLIERVLLEPGDFLYLPRGFPHKAISADCASLHVTVGVNPLYWVDFLKAEVERLSVDRRELRQALPRRFWENGSRERIVEKLQSLLALVRQEASFESTFALLSRNRLTSTTLPPDGHFAELSHLADLAPDSTVERRMDCLVERSGDSVSVSFASNEVRGPMAIAPALEYIRDQERFRVVDLPGGLDEESRLGLARRLIREGLLRTLREAEPNRTEAR